MSSFLSVLLSVLLAFRTLRRNGLRAVLTLAGLLIGVAAVVVVVGLSGGARGFIADRLKSLGTNVIIVSSMEWGSDKRTGKRLTEEDGRAIAREIPSVSGVAPMVATKMVVQATEREITTNVAGTTVSFFEIKDWKVARGETWTPSEETTKAKVCVLGTTAARGLFGNEDPVGRVVRIGKYPYRVLGLLESKGRDVNGTLDQDDRIFMPIGTARTRVTQTKGGEVRLMIIGASSPQSAPRAEQQIHRLLRQRHRVTTRPDYHVMSQVNLLAIQGTVFDALTAFLVCVAAMSLLVGGIGVMNIMLVSVTERTREIGIRLAVGASQTDVLTQFLVEAATLSTTGGVLGIIVGMIALRGFEAALNWAMPVSAEAALVALAVSATTGILFGFAPAHRASRLDPIEALRRE